MRRIIGWTACVLFALSTNPASAGDEPTTRKLDAVAEAELLKLLESEQAEERRAAVTELIRRADRTRSALLTLVRDTEKSAESRTAALEACGAFWNAEVRNLAIDRLQDPLDPIRQKACELLGAKCEKGDRGAHEGLVQLLSDTDSGVLCAAYLAIGAINVPGADEVIVNGIQFDRGKDAKLRDAMVRALERVGQTGFAKLFVLADSGNDKDLERVVEIYPLFRSPEAAKKLGFLLHHYHLSASQLTPLVRGYKEYRVTPPVDFSPLAKVLENLLENRVAGSKSEIHALKLAITDVLGTRSPTFAKWLGEGLRSWERPQTPPKMDDETGEKPAKPSTAIRDLLRTLDQKKIHGEVGRLLTELKGCTIEESTWILRTLGELRDGEIWTPLWTYSRDASVPEPLRREAVAALRVIDAKRLSQMLESSK